MFLLYEKKYRANSLIQWNLNLTKLKVFRERFVKWKLRYKEIILFSLQKNLTLRYILDT